MRPTQWAHLCGKKKQAKSKTVGLCLSVVTVVSHWPLQIYYPSPPYSVPQSLECYILWNIAMGFLSSLWVLLRVCQWKASAGDQKEGEEKLVYSFRLRPGGWMSSSAKSTDPSNGLSYIQTVASLCPFGSRGGNRLLSAFIVLCWFPLTMPTLL